MKPYPLFPSRRRQGQRGYTLLLTLLALLILLLGALYAMRGNIIQVFATGNLAQRQKNVQVSDLALRIVGQTIIDTSTSNDMTPPVPLENIASKPAWYLSSISASPTASQGEVVPGITLNGAPTNFWTDCSTASPVVCKQVSKLTANPSGAIFGDSGYEAWVTVMPAAVPVPPANSGQGAGCANMQFVPRYYSIFLHVIEPNRTTTADTESLFKLCVLAS